MAQTDAQSGRNCCCCDLCDEIRLDCDNCCRCVPRAVCFKFDETITGCDCSNAAEIAFRTTDDASLAVYGPVTLTCNQADVIFLLRLVDHAVYGCSWEVTTTIDDDVTIDLFGLGEMFHCEVDLDVPVEFDGECGGTVEIEQVRQTEIPNVVDPYLNCVELYCHNCRCLCPELCVWITDQYGDQTLYELGWDSTSLAWGSGDVIARLVVDEYDICRMEFEDLLRDCSASFLIECNDDGRDFSFDAEFKCNGYEYDISCKECDCPPPPPPPPPPPECDDCNEITLSNDDCCPCVPLAYCANFTPNDPDCTCGEIGGYMGGTRQIGALVTYAEATLVCESTYPGGSIQVLFELREYGDTCRWFAWGFDANGFFEYSWDVYEVGCSPTVSFAATFGSNCDGIVTLSPHTLLVLYDPPCDGVACICEVLCLWITDPYGEQELFELTFDVESLSWSHPDTDVVIHLEGSSGPYGCALRFEDPSLENPEETITLETSGSDRIEPGFFLSREGFLYEIECKRCECDLPGIITPCCDETPINRRLFASVTIVPTIPPPATECIFQSAVIPLDYEGQCIPGDPDSHFWFGTWEAPEGACADEDCRMEIVLVCHQSGWVIYVQAPTPCGSDQAWTCADGLPPAAKRHAETSDTCDPFEVLFDLAPWEPSFCDNPSNACAQVDVVVTE